MRKNTTEIKLTLTAAGLKRCLTTPTWRNLLHENQARDLRVGDNILTVNNTVWGTLSRLCSDAEVTVCKWASERCEHCGRELTPLQTVWLELSQTDGLYYSQLPAGHVSQGAFPFGAACAGWADGKSFTPYHNK